MAGIYLHIPFCKTRCIYCDFYSTTQSGLKNAYIQALCKELKERRNYLNGAPIETIYLGGGTPSQLEEDDFERIFDVINQVYGLKECKEITLEANPDDLTETYVRKLRQYPFNRLSMGIQTFDDSTLRLLNRRHTARQAIEAIARCRKAGFDNISIDLIYGLPGETEIRWENDLQQAVGLDVEHISAYHLTYESGTTLYDMLQQHKIDEVSEECSIRFYDMLTRILDAAGYEHYEISNFCKPGYASIHNSSYWKGISYLGCGPSAHSFNGDTRQWNVAALKEYIEGIENGKPVYEVEVRDLPTRYNEFIMTALRTKKGASLKTLEETFGPHLQEYCMDMSAVYLRKKILEIKDGYLRLTNKGIFISDGIIADLMFVK